MIKIHHYMQLQILDYSANSSIREIISKKESILLILNPNILKKMIFLCSRKNKILKMKVLNSKGEKKRSIDHNGLKNTMNKKIQKLFLLDMIR